MHYYEAEFRYRESELRREAAQWRLAREALKELETELDALAEPTEPAEPTESAESAEPQAAGARSVTGARVTRPKATSRLRSWFRTAA
ncbi:hypothetical protein NGB36_28090 [Streptomyces sp. RB6PN25]|uniref:Uncharacterized protein n=1 Tax=Streptomyces humicola TaxID=2953240 RepID=A0ABT1Q6C5_9ACTN|nr:hypothetical protein [Streptomyces humicola]MCQ4084337.1 hypothetical protein [Streptomyces humicola]